MPDGGSFVLSCLVLFCSVLFCFVLFCLVSIANLSASCRVKSGSQVVTVSKGSRQLNKRQGELEQLYVDSEGLRVSRGDNGLLYLYVKEETIGDR
jgi:hypothetical protein